MPRLRRSDRFASAYTYTFALGLAACALGSLAGCAKKPAAREVATIPVTAAETPRPNVNIDEELRRICKMHFESVTEAPKFDFDEASLTKQDRDQLEQLARCVTTGPLKGRRLSLVGRADPRGESEYNMVLGDHRADAVHFYLVLLGVHREKLTETSRGELDAEGFDETGWQQDRRVDVHLDGEPTGSGDAARARTEP